MDRERGQRARRLFALQMQLGPAWIHVIDWKLTQKSPLQMSSPQAVSCFGKKKTATAVAHARAGKGLLRINGQPISLVKPEVLRWKVYEPVLVVGEDKFA